jgi:hypothetical protein
MTEQRLIEALEEIKTIIDQALNDKPRRARAHTKESKTKSSPSKKERAGLPEHILKLRDAGFMKQPKTANEVHEKLQSSYHCDVNRVAMALLRLRKRGLLRKASKVSGKRKQVAYVW